MELILRSRNFFIGGVSFHEKKKIGKNYCAWDEKIGSDYNQWVCTHRPEISSLRNGYYWGLVSVMGRQTKNMVLNILLLISLSKLLYKFCDKTSHLFLL